MFFRSCLHIQRLQDFYGDENQRAHLGNLIQITQEKFILYFVDDQSLKYVENYESLIALLYSQVEIMKKNPWFDFSIIFESQNPHLIQNSLAHYTRTSFHKDLSNVQHISINEKSPCPPLQVPQPLSGSFNLTNSYERGANGGTFDYLHYGHKILLSVSLLLLDQFLTVGVTGENLLHNKTNKELLQSFSTRAKVVKEFASLFKPQVHIDLVELVEHAGPTKDGEYELLIVTEETQSAIAYINNLRKQNNLGELVPYIVRLIGGVDALSKLSSSNIRQNILQHNQLTQDQFVFLKTMWLNFVEMNQNNSYYFEHVLVKLYSQTHRFYHTLHHLFHLLVKFQNIKHKTQNQEVIIYAIFFHDIIYYPQKQNNEDESIVLFEEYCQISDPLSETDQNLVKHFITSTKSHRVDNGSSDLYYFLDMDLSILGSADYQDYSKNIRKEYIFMDQEAFNKGRKKVLNRFLESERIFYSEEFFEMYEIKARKNINDEQLQLD